MDKMKRKSEEGLVVTLPVSLPASSKNILAGSSSSECQTVARDDEGPKLLPVLLKTFLMR